MARGFESKDVEFQQAEAAEARRRAGSQPVRPTTVEEREALGKQRTIALALARAKADLIVARSDAHRRMLTDAIAALEKQLGGG